MSIVLYTSSDLQNLWKISRQQVQWITLSAEAWITTAISVASGRSKVSKHEKTNQDESDYESRQPCRIESREGAKEREREMSERGSKAWLNQIPKTSAINGTAPGLLSIKQELHHFGPAEMDIPRLTKEIRNKLVACNQIHVSLQHHHRLYQHQHCLLFLLHDNHRP